MRQAMEKIKELSGASNPTNNRVEIYAIAQAAITADDYQRKLDGISRVNNDVNGNPRFVCHFLALITPEESEELWQSDRSGKIRSAITAQYELALQKSRCIGGKKFHNKQFGGGIAFQVYSKEELLKLIEEVLSGDRKC